MWQELRTELHPKGVEVVTIALDTRGQEAALPWVERANAEHPSLLDQAHVTDELLGFVNVPNAVWVDEGGVIVRPSHVAQVQGSELADAPLPDNLPDHLRDMLENVRKIPRTASKYLPALRDWVEKGAASKYALDPDQVIAKSRPRPPEHGEATAAFELAQHLYRTGDKEAAVRWFRRAHELNPSNWTYKRQAWTLATTQEGQPSDLMQAKTDLYEGSWIDDVKAIGAENYYEPLDFD